ncbi:hypothetical protein ACWC24_07535 [Streptomyces sp. NPDC001443]
MYAPEDDYRRTVALLSDLALYANTIGADLHFVDVAGIALAASLPEMPPGMIPPGYDPDQGPQYPGTGW